MPITKKDVEDFFAKVKEEADEVEDEVEQAAKKAIASAGNFLRSTAAALAKDPILCEAIQAGVGAKIASVAAAVESGGTSLLPGLAMGAAQELITSLGHTAEHELIPIVAGEIHSAVAATTAATPEHVNK